MRRLKVISDEMRIPIFDVELVVTLLAHKRDAKFEGERAVRLFQFRTWIVFPDTTETKYAKWAESCLLPLEVAMYKPMVRIAQCPPKKPKPPPPRPPRPPAPPPAI